MWGGLFHHPIHMLSRTFAICFVLRSFLLFFVVGVSLFSSSPQTLKPVMFECVRQQQAPPGKPPLKHLSDTLFALQASIINAPAPFTGPWWTFFSSSRRCQFCEVPQRFQYCVRGGGAKHPHSCQWDVPKNNNSGVQRKNNSSFLFHETTMDLERHMRCFRSPVLYGQIIEAASDELGWRCHHYELNKCSPL